MSPSKIILIGLGCWGESLLRKKNMQVYPETTKGTKNVTSLVKQDNPKNIFENIIKYLFECLIPQTKQVRAVKNKNESSDSDKMQLDMDIKCGLNATRSDTKKAPILGKIILASK